MKKIILCCLCVLLLSEAAFAATVTKNLNVIWDFDVSEESTIAGFKLYNQNGTIVADNIAPALRSYSVSYTFDDTVAQAFHLIAFDKDGKQTTPSNIGIWVPRYKGLTGMGKVTIEFSDVQ